MSVLGLAQRATAPSVLWHHEVSVEQRAFKNTVSKAENASEPREAHQGDSLPAGTDTEPSPIGGFQNQRDTRS